MSIQAFTDFRRMVNDNPDLAAATKAAIAGGEEQAIIGLARKYGFEFTGDEALAQIQGAELSDLELELVAGGTMLTNANVSANN